jgi:hypothetical protein
LEGKNQNDQSEFKGGFKERVYEFALDAIGFME